MINTNVMTKDEFFEAIDKHDFDKACACFQFYIDHFPITVEERIIMQNGVAMQTNKRQSMRISHFDGTGSNEAQIFTMKKLLDIKSKLEEYYTKNY